MILSLLISALCFFLTLASLFFSADANHTAMIAVSTLPIFLITLYLLAFNIRDNFSPLNILLYLMFIGVTVKMVFFIFFDFEGTARWISLGDRDLDILWGGLTTVLGAVIALLTGYTLGFLCKKRSPVQTQNTFIGTRALFWTLWIGWALSGSFILIFLWKIDALDAILHGQITAKRFIETPDGTRIVAASFYLRWIGQTLPQILFLIALVHYRKFPDMRSAGIIIPFVLLGLNSVAIPVLTSDRLELAYLIILSVMVSHYAIKRISFTTLGVLAIVVVGVLGVLGSLRDIQTSNLELEEADFSVQKIIAHVVGRSYLLDIGKTSVIIDAVPRRVDYLYGTGLLKIFIAPIPRSLWPDKPVLQLNWFVRETIFEREDLSGIPPGFIGELYLNYGQTGVLLGMAVLGFILNLVYARILALSQNNITFLIYVIAMVTLTLSLLTVELVNTISQIVRYTLPFAIIYVLAAKSVALTEPQSKVQTT